MLDNKQILITGGTGSFGQAFIKYIFKHYPEVKRVVGFSRDEQKQFAMAMAFSPKVYPIKYVFGDVAKAVAPEAKTEVVGICKGEKIDEVFFSSFESYDTVEREEYYVICSTEGRWDKKQYMEKTSAKPVKEGFEYDSKSNGDFLSVDEIRGLIENEVIL